MNFSDLLPSHGDGATIRKSEALAIGDVSRERRRKAGRVGALLEAEATRWEWRKHVDEWAEGQLGLPGVA